MICEYCKIEFVPSRSDARFCSKACKSKFWYNQKKSPEKIENTLQSSLKGVLDESSEAQPDYITVQETTLSDKYVQLKKYQNEMLTKKKTIESNIEKIKKEILEIEQMNGIEIPIVSTGIGAVVSDPTFKQPTKNVIGGLAGLVIGSIIKESMQQEREQKKKTLITQKNQVLQFLQNQLNVVLSNLEKVKAEIALTPATVVIEKKQARLQLTQPIESVNLPQNLTGTNSQKLNSIVSKNTKETHSDKIISSKELSKHDYKALCFTDKWMHFIGYPSINFQCAIHGRAGEGKSTFAIQFAMYLSENFGKVIYISSEEGFSKTFKDKFVRNNAISDNLYVADLRSYDDIIKEIPVDAYHFIFIDSLNNMRIDAELLKNIRERYKNSSIITISQATKDGKMRGSYEIIHDVDIEIIVNKGVAMTNKNRFKEKEIELKVF